MDKTFHEIQAKVAKRLIHSDRHRRRKSIGPDIVTCNSKNHDLSRLMVKNEVLFKNLEGKMSSLENEKRRRENELLRTERALAGSVRKRSLPHLTNKSAQGPRTKGKTPASRQPRRNSLIKDGLLSPTSCNQLVQKWLKSFDSAESTSKNTLEVPPFFDSVLEPKSAFRGERKSGFVSELIGADLESNGEDIYTNDNTTKNALEAPPLFELEPKIRCFEGEALDTKVRSGSDLESGNGLVTSFSTFIEADRASSSLYTLAKIRISDAEKDGAS